MTVPSYAPAPAPSYAAPSYAVAPPTDGVAIAAFVTALCGFGLIPVVLGHVALGRIRRTGAGGTAFAVVGLVLGYTVLVVGAIVLAAVAGAIWWGVTA